MNPDDVEISDLPKVHEKDDPIEFAHAAFTDAKKRKAILSYLEKLAAGKVSSTRFERTTLLTSTSVGDAY